MPLAAERITHIRSVPDEQRIVFVGQGAVLNVGNSVPDVLQAVYRGHKYNTVDLVKNPPFHAKEQGHSWEAEEVRIGNPLKLTHPNGTSLNLDEIDRSTRRNADMSAQIAILATREMLKGSFKDGQIPEGLVTGVIEGCAVGGTLNLVTYNDLYLANLADKRTRRVLTFASTNVLPGQAAAFVGSDIDARGPKNTVSSECDTAITVLRDAANLLLTRQDRFARMAQDDPRGTDAQFVIAGTTDITHKPISYRIFDSVLGQGALSRRNEDPETASRPFDAGANGFVFGEGAVQFGMMTLAKARELDIEDRILGELLSVAHVSDPKSSNPIFPSDLAVAESMRLALVRAGLQASEVDFIHAHATSTGQSEITESTAIKAIFGNAVEEGGIPTISTKSITGHTLTSAGSIGVMVGFEAMRTGEIPPNWNLFEVNPKVADIWLPKQHVKRNVDVVMINAQGFGGNNGSALIARFIG